MGRRGKGYGDGTVTAAYFPRRFFTLGRHEHEKLFRPRIAEKRKAQGPQRGRFQLESVAAGGDVPKLSCQRRSRSMAARTGCVPRWR